MLLGCTYRLAANLGANRGPLSADGLSEIYHELLDLTKREVAREEEKS